MDNGRSHRISQWPLVPYIFAARLPGLHKHRFRQDNLLSVGDIVYGCGGQLERH
jgi:hypothetical protein